MFDDFDIDYNAQKYLIETRCSGALIKPYSAIALELQSRQNRPKVKKLFNQQHLFNKEDTNMSKVYERYEDLHVRKTYIYVKADDVCRRFRQKG